jgi:REP element-mobilizing transposase RayT
VTFYRRNLPHLQRDCKPHFILLHSLRSIAVSCRDGHETLCSIAVCMIMGKKYNLPVAVVMQDHAHMIRTPLIDEIRASVFSLAEIMKGIKGTSSHAINRKLRSHETIWQEESFDHVLRSSESLDAKIDYILQNPVRAGLVKMATKYPWSWRKVVESPYAPAQTT